MDHEQKVEMAGKAIQKVFEDTTVSQSQTVESLQGLQEEIEQYLESLDES